MYSMLSLGEILNELQSLFIWERGVVLVEHIEKFRKTRKTRKLNKSLKLSANMRL